jgi:hypothetical protein
LTRITVANRCSLLSYCVGDVLNTGEIVVALDEESCTMLTRKATWWRRAWARARAAVRHAWWWLKCTGYDLVELFRRSP